MTYSLFATGTQPIDLSINGLVAEAAKLLPAKPYRKHELAKMIRIALGR